MSRSTRPTDLQAMHSLREAEIEKEKPSVGQGVRAFGEFIVGIPEKRLNEEGISCCSGCMCMGTGTGKTGMMARIGTAIERSETQAGVIYMAPDSVLTDSLYAGLTSSFGIRFAEDRKDMVKRTDDSTTIQTFTEWLNEGKHIIIAGDLPNFNELMGIVSNKFVLADEAHDYPIEILKNIKQKNAVIGFTGTPTLALTSEVFDNALPIATMALQYTEQLGSYATRKMYGKVIEKISIQAIAQAALRDHLAQVIYLNHGRPSDGYVDFANALKENKITNADKAGADKQDENEKKARELLEKILHDNCIKSVDQKNFVFAKNYKTREALIKEYKNIGNLSDTSIKAINEERRSAEIAERASMLVLMYGALNSPQTSAECKNEAIRTTQYKDVTKSDILIEIQNAQNNQIAIAINSLATSMVFGIGIDTLEKELRIGKNAGLAKFLIEKYENNAIDKQKIDRAVENFKSLNKDGTLHNYQKNLSDFLSSGESKDTKAWQAMWEQFITYAQDNQPIKAVVNAIKDLPTMLRLQSVEQILDITNALVQIANMSIDTAQWKNSFLQKLLTPEQVGLKKFDMQIIEEVSTRTLQQPNGDTHKNACLAKLKMGYLKQIVSDQALATGISINGVLATQQIIETTKDMDPLYTIQAQGRSIRTTDLGALNQIIVSEKMDSQEVFGFERLRSSNFPALLTNHQLRDQYTALDEELDSTAFTKKAITSIRKKMQDILTQRKVLLDKVQDDIKERKRKGRMEELDPQLQTTLNKEMRVLAKQKENIGYHLNTLGALGNKTTAKVSLFLSSHQVGTIPNNATHPTVPLKDRKNKP